ncbi:hypothetical protein JRO89_XS04G0005100 [Xanthoceras sorbifolium]|uniref:MADS-box domain-containing protein n=1 Tax=Xanthoceras sorbifolium TaxID=99658 RepID=A0ABQ8I3V9_9ROSI|nr:hypothetical protein JRO89_XS04G0005100 [Xanthoceras sorbifolium]
MTRKKVKLAYIANDSARKATFKKRKKGLMKKVSELSTLCGIDACAIVFSPYDSQPEVWPSNLGVQRVLSNFKKMPEMEQSKKMVNQDSFLRQRIVKATEQLKKQRKDNREKEMTQVMFQSLVGRSIHQFNIMDLNDLGWLIEQYLKEVYKKDDAYNKLAAIAAGASSSSGLPIPLPPPQHPATPDLHGGVVMRHVGESSQQGAAAGSAAGGYEMNNMETVQKQQWFMDLMNPQDQQQMGFGGDDMVLPFGDTSQTPLWSNGFFP